jgi:hypothetical protein
MKCIHGIRRRRRTLAKLIGAVIFWYVSMVIRLLHCLDEYTWGVLATAVVGSILFVCVRLLAIRVGKTSGKRLCLQLGWLSIRRGEPRPTSQPVLFCSSPASTQPLLLFSRKGKVVQPANYSKRQQQVSLSVGAANANIFYNCARLHIISWRAWKKIRRLTHSCRTSNESGCELIIFATAFALENVTVIKSSQQY